MHNEVRKHYFLDEYVIFSPSRSDRPYDFDEDSIDTFEQDNNYRSDCPFCRGNEEMIEIIPEIDIESDNINIVANKFPSLSRDFDFEKKSSRKLFNSWSAHGYHDVIIETPHHNVKLFDFDIKQLESYTKAIKKRYGQLINKQQIKYVSIFKNSGKQAGASLEHAHTQILASSVMPGRIKEEVEASKKYFENENNCVGCDIINEELNLDERVIIEEDDFVVIAPYASIWPYETSIYPKFHCSDITQLTKDQLNQLAKTMHKLFSSYYECFDYIPYNMVFFNYPKKKYCHFRIDIYPRIQSIAGLEHLGLNINEVLPERATEVLKDKNREK